MWPGWGWTSNYASIFLSLHHFVADLLIRRCIFSSMTISGYDVLIWIIERILRIILEVKKGATQKLKNGKWMFLFIDVFGDVPRSWVHLHHNGKCIANLFEECQVQGGQVVRYLQLTSSRATWPLDSTLTNQLGGYGWCGNCACPQADLRAPTKGSDLHTTILIWSQNYLRMKFKIL